jgi:hypothetical protein
MLAPVSNQAIHRNEVAHLSSDAAPSGVFAFRWRGLRLSRIGPWTHRSGSVVFSVHGADAPVVAGGMKW